MWRALFLLIGVAGCGRILFEPRDQVPAAGDASPSADAPVPDAAPPMVCSTIGFTCLDGGNMKCGDACFAYCNEPTTHASAVDICAAWGGEPASIASTAEQTCANGLSTNDAWLGLVQDAGAVQVDADWRWTDGTIAPITNWNSFEPEDTDGIEDGEQQCAIQSAGGWADVACDENKPFICKRPAL